MPDTKWKPGQSGNPKGRPRLGNALAEIVRWRVDKNKLVKKLRSMAENGNIDAAKLLLAYGWGSPPSAPLVEVNVSSQPQYDLSRLSFDQLLELKRLSQIMHDGVDPGPVKPGYEPPRLESGDVIDAETVEETSDATDEEASNTQPEPGDAPERPPEAPTSTSQASARPGLNRVIAIDQPLKDKNPERRYRW